jgi:sortase (surface protein transpeptidase)
MNVRATLVGLLTGSLIALAGCAHPDAAPVLPEGPPASAADTPVHAPDPTGLDIPAIGVHTTDLVKLGLDEHNELQIPDDATVTGWYPLSPAPGDPGPAVIAAHVNYNGTPGVFAHLRELRPGDDVKVARADGTTATFRVYAADRYSKDAFPTEKVYRNTEGPELRLITCGGPLDSAAHSYRDNVVVSARQV